MSVTYTYPAAPAVSVDTTGLATAANQVLEIAELTAINTNTAGLDVLDQLDTPLLVASSTNIPASASTPLTVIATLAANIKAVNCQDTTGEYIGIYSDPAGTPVLQCIINPGSDSILPLKLTAGTTIGLRNMKNAAITEGDLVLQFLG